MLLVINFCAFLSLFSSPKSLTLLSASSKPKCQVPEWKITTRGPDPARESFLSALGAILKIFL